MVPIGSTIRPGDFAPASPLRLVIPSEAEVFDCRITRVTAPEIRAGVDTPGAMAAGVAKEIPVRFDYLDGGDGFSIQVIHDGLGSQIRFEGKLPGVKEFRSGDSNMLAPYTPAVMRWVFFPLTCIAMGWVGLVSLYSAFFAEFHWYYVPGALMVGYFFVPLAMLREPNAPRVLWERASAADETSG